MILDRALRRSEGIRNLPVAVPAPHQAQRLDLTATESLRAINRFEILGHLRGCPKDALGDRRPAKAGHYFGNTMGGSMAHGVGFHFDPSRSSLKFELVRNGI